ncbi:MAG TPA: ABC transporter ATP-binding protein, partial [Thermotoga sp.]|nr:ABC transporter ATP-binding protein [Thermotoga sp.]
MGDVLEVKDLVKRYGKLLVLDRWSLKVSKGERIVLLGPSGCGKTTFLKIIAGLEGYDEGELYMDFKSLGFVFQEPRLIPWRTVKKNLSFVSDNEGKIKEILKMVRLEGFENHLPSQLSGGMRQRVNLA